MFQVEHPKHLNPAAMYQHRQFPTVEAATAFAEDCTRETGYPWTVYELVPVAPKAEKSLREMSEQAWAEVAVAVMGCYSPEARS